MSSDSSNATNLTVVSDSHIFAIYCYETYPTGNINGIGCTTYLLLNILTLLSLIPICVILFRQVKRSEKNILKIVTLVIMLVLEIIVFFHYFLVINRGDFYLINS